MFTVTVKLEDRGTFPTFAEAFEKFWTDMTALMKAGTSLQVIETACWIEMKRQTRFGEVKIPMLFNAARDFAYDIGLLTTDGELADPVPEIDPFRVTHQFIYC